jgi:hypothetical protein
VSVVYGVTAGRNLARLMLPRSVGITQWIWTRPRIFTEKRPAGVGDVDE